VSKLTLESVVEQIDSVHRDLAQLTVDQLLGRPYALNSQDVLESHPVPLRPKTLEFLRKSLKATEDPQEKDRIERILFGCMDLVAEEETLSLGDMLNFYMERGRMIVDGTKIPALEVVPWLQSEPDFERREQMRKEMTIFLKGIVNPMLLGSLELTLRAVTGKLGYADYARYCEAKKGVSFSQWAQAAESYLQKTDAAYQQAMAPWVEEIIGRPMTDLSRYHAIHLLRIRKFDEYFPLSGLREVVGQTFARLGLDLSSDPGVSVELSDRPAGNRDGLCVGVEIPAAIFVVMRPVGGLSDVETLLHEMGHAFLLRNIDPRLPVEYRRLYRSAALDETFAILFMNLIENPAWLTGVVGMPASAADELTRLHRIKKLCLVRRYIGKFLAEKEFHEKGDIKDSAPYCRHLGRATGFTYEAQGYLIDMESDFYSLDYLAAWAGADVLSQFLEIRFGQEWFNRAEAGAFLREIASSSRRDGLEKVLEDHCGETLRLPDFDN
jgi:hypothetical protein